MTLHSKCLTVLNMAISGLALNVQHIFYSFFFWFVFCLPLLICWPDIPITSVRITMVFILMKTDLNKKCAGAFKHLHLSIL